MLDYHTYLCEGDLVKVNDRVAVVIEATRHHETCGDGCCYYPTDMTLVVRFADDKDKFSSEYEVDNGPLQGDSVEEI